jgi:hypothetical protein
LGWNALSGGTGETDFINSQGGGGGGFAFMKANSDGTRTLLNFIDGSGNVGIGSPAPGAKLEVNGNIKLTAGTGASITFADNTVQNTAWNGTTFGGDYAESIDVLGNRAEYEPGDVIVIDGSETGMFDKSAEPYSKMVAGVFSTKPGLEGRRVTADRPDKNSEVPMAMMGIVPVKACSAISRAGPNLEVLDYIYDPRPLYDAPPHMENNNSHPCHNFLPAKNEIASRGDYFGAMYYGSEDIRLVSRFRLS